MLPLFVERTGKMSNFLEQDLAAVITFMATINL